MSATLSIVTSFVVARVVGPNEFGIGAAALAVNVLLWVVVNALFADALVQRKAIDNHILSSAFWASAGVGCIAMLLQVAAGWGLAAMLDDRRLVPMCLVLAAPLPLVGAAGVIQGLLTRERAYRRLALRTLIGQGLGTAVGACAAFAGAGAWALVLQQAVTTGCGALALLIAREWTPSRRLDWAAVRSLLTIGGPLTASTLVLIARYRLFAVLIGGTAGAAVLGEVHIAFRLVDTIRELTFTALWRLMLPALSEHQHDRRAMLAQVDHWLRWCAIVVFPMCVLLAIGLTQVVAAVDGTQMGVRRTGRGAPGRVAGLVHPGVSIRRGPDRDRTGPVHPVRQSRQPARQFRRRAAVSADGSLARGDDLDREPGARQPIQSLGERPGTRCQHHPPADGRFPAARGGLTAGSTPQSDA